MSVVGTFQADRAAVCRHYLGVAWTSCDFLLPPFRVCRLYDRRGRALVRWPHLLTEKARAPTALGRHVEFFRVSCLVAFGGFATADAAPETDFEKKHFFFTCSLFEKQQRRR
nr:hypothetical protein [Pandoravirus massiliensis]